MIPRLPTYSDSENLVFHPVFEYALKEALKQKKLNYVEVRRQYPSPTGPIDLVLFNTKTQKVILPIEIKRTQSNVRGGGRRQARDYWQNLGSKCETQFYCVSNLELIELFRFETTRPKTSAQQVKLQQPISGDLDSRPNSHFFYQTLIENICDVLDIVLGNKPYIYAVGLPELQNNLESAVNDPDLWHKLLIPTCFEYIRGAASKIDHLNNSWKPASFYAHNPTRLIASGKKIDFEHVFKEPAPAANDKVVFSTTILTEAYNAGKELGGGDEIAELINEILTDYVPKKQGIVETDTELARLLAVIAKVTLGRKLEEYEKVIDPASGSGRLLTVLEQSGFTEITPKQIKAIEKEPLFSEALSLRLGLAFGTNISPSNAPSVIIKGIEEIDKFYFDDVKVLIMNPPFISGVQSKEIKDIFSKRIKELSGQKPKLDLGQAALEILFLELICNLVPDGTVISVIFPSNHLFRISNEMTAFRNYLLDHFGLNYIVTYPRNGLFSNVVKGTVILSGIKGKKVDNVNLIEVWESVNDIQLDNFYNSLFNNKNLSSDSSLGVTYRIGGNNLDLRIILTSDLKSKSAVGWQEVMGAGRKGEYFINKYMKDFQNISKSSLSRGKFGNKGNNNLTVINKVNKKYPTVYKKIPSDWLVPLLNNTDNMPRLLSSTSASHISFNPPDLAYVSDSSENIVLNDIINEFLSVYKHKAGSQIKELPNEEKIILSLKSNNKKYSNLILLPRASRVKGEVGIIESEQAFISTNLLLIDGGNIDDLQLMGSWFLSVFGQLQLELYGVSQEGMRKLEKGIIEKIKYPNFSKISKDKADQLRCLFYTEQCINFSKIEEREIDRVWAEVLFPKNDIKLLEEAFDVFQELVDNRLGLG
ncbi:BpuSI family type II restriction endonuclease [Acinetobacter variabilis]|uniref:BpuSI family type II restriction endonuclease n=1 Tax=Acinetobacter variabilis TaxID=70346 RepID=UPI003A841268